MTISLQEVKSSADKAMEAFQAIQSEIAPLKKSFEELDADSKGKLEKMGAEIAKGAEATRKFEAELKAREDINKALEEKQKTLEEKQAILEAALNRPPAAQQTDEQKASDIAKRRNRLFNEFARKDYGTRSEYFDNFLKEAVTDEVERKAMSVNSDPDGGFLVQPEFAGTVQTYIYESSPMRELATVMTIGTDSVDWIVDNGKAESGWVMETQARPETATPKISILNIPANEIYAQPKVTQKLLDDAQIDIESWLAGKVAQEFARQENAAFMVGDGLGKPRGVLTYAAGTDVGLNQIEQINSGSASSYDWKNLVALQFRLKGEYRRNAAYLMNRTALFQLYSATGTDGHPIYQTVVDPNGLIRERVNGYPVYEAADMPEVATNNLSVAFGDFRRAYVIVDRTGIRVLRDPYTDKPFVKFYTTKRVGGAVVNYEAVKLLKIAA